MAAQELTYYWRDPAHEHQPPRAAIVALVDGSGYVSAGIALCNPKDQFCYKTARSIARSRAQKVSEQGIPSPGMPRTLYKKSNHKLLGVGFSWPQLLGMDNVSAERRREIHEDLRSELWARFEVPLSIPGIDQAPAS